MVEKPTLVVVHQGTKVLKGDGFACTIKAGEAVALAGGQAFDVTNHPAPSGVYEAVWLVCDPAIIAQTTLSAPSLQPILNALPVRPLESGFQAALARGIEAIVDSQHIPPAIASHRLGEVLVWISQHGGRFENPRSPLVSGQVRAVLSSAPDQAWAAAEIAKHLAMSEATLRRRLAAEGCSLSELLIDVRMSHGLALLQATDLPITQVARECGYESASRFAIRFRQRFGFPPMAIRGGHLGRTAHL